jgi:hypothetical protein
VQTSPPGPALYLPVLPTDYLRQGGGAIWDRVAHERGKTSLRFMGVEEHTVSLQLLLDDQLAPGPSRFSRPTPRARTRRVEPWRWTELGAGDVEAACQLLHLWALPVDRSDPLSEPPQVQIAFLFGQQLRWVLDGEPTWNRQEFDPVTGRRVHADVTVRLVEAEFATIGLSPVEAAAAPATGEDAGTPADVSTEERTHVVAPRETLTSIAAALLGDGSRYREIATLNSLPDPDLIIVGQVLRIPPA